MRRVNRRRDAFACSILALVLLAPTEFARGQQPPAAPAPAVAAPAKAQQSEAWKVIDDDWMIMEIAGARVGWMNSVTEQAGDHFRTSTTSSIKVGRGDAVVSIRMDSAFIETAEGKPVSVDFVQNMAQQAVETTWEFQGDKVVQTTRQGDRTNTSDKPLPKGDWFTPHKADQYAKAQRKAGAKEISYSSIDPQNGLKPVSLKTTRTGETDYEIDGKKTHVEVWTTTTDIMPLKTTEYVDADGEMVYQEVPTGMGKIVMRRATKAQATADVVGGGVEVLERTFVKPDKPITNSMKATHAKLRLTAREGTLPDLPSAGSQRVEMSDDHKSAVLTIDINDELPATDGEKVSDEFTKRSTMVDYDDELVTKLSNGAKDSTSEMARADALRKIANKRISKKDMNTAFASASETARTQTGDCSEHGVLLAALLRAQHIPSRVAMGMVYAESFMGKDGIFGWHMWTQALIDGKWVDLDATLPVRYSAVHVLTNTSSLADGLGAADMASIMQVIGNVDVQVLDVGYAKEN